MRTKLTDRVVSKLPPPGRGNAITYDSEVKGFGVRVTAAGAKSFVLNYRTREGRERRYTIGTFGPSEWGTVAARREAGEMKRRLRDGFDPLGTLQADRDAATVLDLWERYEREHLPRKRPASQRDDRNMVGREILPVLGKRKVASISYSDLANLHQRITGRGKAVRANRVHSLLSKMFGLAIRWGLRTDNPARGIERNPESRRQRYLAAEELKRLASALDAHKDQCAANAVRLLLLTGARKGELLAATWEQFDLVAGVWVKPASATKQKRIHRVPLSSSALALLAAMKADGGNVAFLFPRPGGTAPRRDLKKPWEALCQAAGLMSVRTVHGKGGDREKRRPSARLHDLRHTYASLLVSAGVSLPMVGALLGHTQAQTTARYAHLFDDPLRKATETAASLIAPVLAEQLTIGQPVPMAERWRIDTLHPHLFSGGRQDR